jgi:hypothetical protein
VTFSLKDNNAGVLLDFILSLNRRDHASKNDKKSSNPGISPKHEPDKNVVPMNIKVPARHIGCLTINTSPSRISDH